MFWFAFKLIGGVVFVALAICAFVVYGYSFGQGLTKAEMDWNRDGTTTLWEIVDAGSYGLAITQQGDRECRRIFAYKDGMTHSDSCADGAVTQ